jgi:hypothetical protein
MINFIKRNDLDIEKYDACIENSIQSRIYAFSWYLDIVADNWDVLVLDDYKAVMPIPWKQKYFIKYVTQPFFSQQLGVFSKREISKEIENKFLKAIPKKFLKISLNFNSDSFLSHNLIQKKNFILKLNNTYDVAFKSFSKGRKHAVKVGLKHNLILKETSILSLIKIQKEFYSYTNYSENKLEQIVGFSLKMKNGFVFGVFKDDVLIGGAFFLKTKSRITYLFSSFTNEGRKLQASSFLLSSVIKKYENSNLLLDFEGGNIPNIGSFYKSFGAKIENYHFLKRTFL